MSECLSKKDFVNSFVKDDSNQYEKKHDLKSYFNRSLFFEGILYPLGSNIVPKTDIEQDLSTGYKYCYKEHSIKKFDINQVSVYNLFENIRGNFLLYERKIYNYYWDNERDVQTNCKIMPFVMFDEGNFNSNIRIVHGREVVVDTIVYVNRNVTGYNFDRKSIRDGLFKNFVHDNCMESLNIVEYYKLIANGTRLLHYSDYSDLFEIYELPNGWHVEDGLSKLESPRVFNDKSDIHDKDLNEIRLILDSRSNNKNMSLVNKK